MKLPENIKYYDSDSGEVLEQATADFVKKIVKDFKVKAIGDKQANDVVKDLLNQNFRTKGEDVELSEETEHLGNVNDFCKELATEHRKISDEEDEASKQAKELKAQEKTLAKEAKDKEEKEYKQNQDKFEEAFVKKAKGLIDKAEASVQVMMKGIKLPSSITLSGNGMGMLISEGATKDDIATAAAQMIAANEGNKAMAGALQFLMGDAVNALVTNRVYRTKGEACKQVGFLITEKLGRKFSGGGINANALMAQRIAPDKRIMGKPPSLYYGASKVVLPTLKEASASEKVEMEKKFDAERNNIIEKINDGTISSNADLTEHIKEFKKSCGLIVETPGDARKAKDRFLARLAWALLAKRILLKDGVVKFRELDVDDEAPAVEYTVGQITDIEEEALNNLQNILLTGYDVALLTAGEHEVEVEETKETEKDGKTVKTKTKVKKIVPYLLSDPFESKDGEQEAKEEKPAETPAPAAEEVEEETEEETEEE